MTGNISSWPGTLFGLLHVSAHQQQHANLKTSASALDVYLGCAALCAKSMASVGQHFRLITNAPEVLAHRAEVLGLPHIDLAPYDFHWSVPSNLRFHSAHYKLEIYQAFGEGIFGTQVGLVDIDTVMFRRFASSPPSGGLMTYDISAQYLELAPDRVKGDLERIVGRPLVSPKWYGGELLCGDTTGFKRLHGQIEALWPRYLKVASELDHVGDEAIVSAALALLKAEEFPIIDAGASGDIARWWSGRILHHQDSFAQASQAALLHLPSDKTFLARAARRGLTGTKLQLSYRRYLMRRLTLQQAVRLLGVVRGRPREYVPRLR